MIDALRTAIDRRGPLLEALGPSTDCVRLLHGIAEGAPGLAVDRYGPVLLIQTWREPLELSTVEALARVARDALGVELHPVWNHRGEGGGSYAAWHDPVVPDDPVGLEEGLRYDVQPRHRGDDPLLFLDLRAGRRRVRAASAGARVLNLFAYTCGVGVAALAGGAAEVLNVDFAASALEVGDRNAVLNGLGTMGSLCEDVFPVIRQLAGLPVGGRRGRRPRFTRLEPRTFDLVVLDPPRWARSAWGAVDVVRDYQSLFKPALLATAPGGQLLVTNHVARVDADRWLDVLRRCADKAGRPLIDVELFGPDDDFPSFDGRPPLKLAWVRPA